MKYKLKQKQKYRTIRIAEKTQQEKTILYSGRGIL